MRRHVLGVALLVAAAAMPAYADHDRFLTISGDGTGYVDVRFPESFTLDGTFAKYRSTGTVTGFYVRRLGAKPDDPTSMAFNVRGFDVVSRTPELPAGAYRVYLVADRGATVRILARGLHRDITARVRHRRALTTNVGPVDLRPDAAPVRHRGARATRLRGGNTFLMTIWRVTMPSTPGWGGVTACFAPAESACETPTEGLVPTGNVSTSSRSSSTPYEPGSVAGPTVLYQRYAGTVDAEVTTAAIELSL